MMARNLSLLALVAVLVLAAAWAGSDMFVLRQVRALLDVKVDREFIFLVIGLHEL